MRALGLIIHWGIRGVWEEGIGDASVLAHIMREKNEY
jgi:hypothetical protein